MNRLERFEQGPMTASTAEFLAQTFGDGATIDEFAASLPDAARVIDVGAGLSGLGAAVAARREDITWTNFDINYCPGTTQSGLLDEARRSAPFNLSFVQGDVLNLPASLLGQHELAVSYNVLSHFMRIDQKLGAQALKGMVALLNPDTNGLLMVGPTNARMASDERWKAAMLTARARDGEIEEVQQLLTSPTLANIYYNASQASGVGIYPAGRFGADDHGRVVLSDDGGQSYHRVASKHGLALGGRLVAGLFHS